MACELFYVSGRFWWNQGGFQFLEATAQTSLSPLNWFYDQWQTFWRIELPAESELQSVMCEASNQFVLCNGLTLQEHQIMGADTVFGDFNNDGWVEFLVVFDDKMWILGGGTYNTPAHPTRTFYNDVWSSSDGVNWIEVLADAPWEPRQYHSVAVFSDRMWMMEGYHGCWNDVWKLDLVNVMESGNYDPAIRWSPTAKKRRNPK